MSNSTLVNVVVSVYLHCISVVDIIIYQLIMLLSNSRFSLLATHAGAVAGYRSSCSTVGRSHALRLTCHR